MKKDMLSDLVKKIANLSAEFINVVYDLVEKLSGEAGREWLAELNKFLRKEKCWINAVANTLLEVISIVTIPATIEKFVASEKFICDTRKKAKIKIKYIGHNFTEWFSGLGNDGKVEASISEQTLRYVRLKKISDDEPIITEIGGEEKAETSLAEMFALMAKQPNGENGALLTSGLANIFYICDKNAVLRTVFCLWRGDGWRVNADSVDAMDRWNIGHQVFFRVPVAA